MCVGVCGVCVVLGSCVCVYLHTQGCELRCVTMCWVTELPSVCLLPSDFQGEKCNRVTAYCREWAI